MRVDDLLRDLELLDKHGINIRKYAICQYDVDYTPICMEYDAGSQEEFISRVRELDSKGTVFTAIIRIILKDIYRIGIYYPYNYDLRYWKITDLERSGIIGIYEEQGPIEKLITKKIHLTGYPILEGVR